MASDGDANLEDCKTIDWTKPPLPSGFDKIRVGFFKLQKVLLLKVSSLVDLS